MYILIYSIKKMCQFFHNVKNRVILWCLSLYADARGPVEVFVAFLIWTPHFFIHIYVFFFLSGFLFNFILNLHSLTSVAPLEHNPFHAMQYKPLQHKVFVYIIMIRL